jgi:BMFP domain-containing protein YqiC
MLGSFDELTSKLLAALPSSLQNLDKDIQQQFKAILQAAFAHMDLVTREEFDIQAKVLARTREKVDNLEKQIENILNKEE